MQQKELRNRDPETYNAKQRECRNKRENYYREWKRNWEHKYNSSNPEKIMLRRAKKRAKKNNLPFNIEIEDIFIPENCPILGLKLELKIGKGKGAAHNSPSLDKIIPKLGYVKGNVRVISNRANTLKKVATIEGIQKIAEDMAKHFFISSL